MFTVIPSILPSFDETHLFKSYFYIRARVHCFFIDFESNFDEIIDHSLYGKYKFSFIEIQPRSVLYHIFQYYCTNPYFTVKNNEFLFHC